MQFMITKQTWRPNGCWKFRNSILIPSCHELRMLAESEVILLKIGRTIPTYRWSILNKRRYLEFDRSFIVKQKNKIIFASWQNNKYHRPCGQYCIYICKTTCTKIYCLFRFSSLMTRSTFESEPSFKVIGVV